MKRIPSSNRIIHIKLYPFLKRRHILRILIQRFLQPHHLHRIQYLQYCLTPIDPLHVHNRLDFIVQLIHHLIRLKIFDRLSSRQYVFFSLEMIDGSDDLGVRRVRKGSFFEYRGEAYSEHKLQIFLLKMFLGHIFVHFLKFH